MRKTVGMIEIADIKHRKIIKELFERYNITDYRFVPKTIIDIKEGKTMKVHQVLVPEEQEKYCENMIETIYMESKTIYDDNEESKLF